MKSFLEPLGEAMKKFSQRPAFVQGSACKTFADVAADVDKTESWLRQSGCKEGDRIAALTFNCTEAVILEWATYRFCGTWIGVPALERDLGNLERLLQDFTPRLLLLELGALGKSLSSLQAFPYEETNLPPHFDATHFQMLRHMGGTRRTDRLTVGSDSKPVVRIRYTSGATGEPKAIAYTEKTVTAILKNILEFITPELKEEETVVHGLPCVWASGSLIAPAFCRGGKNVLLPKWDLSSFVDAVTKEQSTLTLLVPNHVADLARYSERSGDGWAGDGRARKLRVLVAGGPTPISTMQRAREALPGVRFFVTLGQTEASFPVTLHEVTNLSRRRPFVPLGPLTLPYRSSSVDPKTGELKLQGDALAAGQWSREASCFLPLDRPHATGDLVEKDDDDVLHYRGRLKGLQRNWPAPEAIEALFREYPGVKRARVDHYEDLASGGVCIDLTVEPIAARVENATLVDFFNSRRVEASLSKVSLRSLRFSEVALTMSGKIKRASGRPGFSRWQEFDLSRLASGPLYFYVGAGLSIGAGLVEWNELACIIWWYLEHYEKGKSLSGCPPDDAEANAQFLQSFIDAIDRTGKRILSRRSKDSRGLGRTALLNMMLRYRAPSLPLQSRNCKAHCIPGAGTRSRPGKEPDEKDLLLQSLIWRSKCNGVLTSNYDMLLEHAYSLFGHGAALRSYRYDADFLRYVLSNRQFVLKLHGDINDIGTMELDPQRAWNRDKKGSLRGQRGEDLKRVYRAILQRGHMIYLGCGFRDPTIKNLHDSWKPKSQAPRNCRVALIPEWESSGKSAQFKRVEFLTFSRWIEVKEFLERVEAVRISAQEPWNPCPEASDLHKQIFRSRDASPPVQHFKTEPWTCRGVKP